MEHISYRGLDFEIPALAGDGIVIAPDRITVDPGMRRRPIVRDAGCGWDLERFLDIRSPVSVGFVPDARVFSGYAGSRILDLPVKFPGTEYRLPDEVAAFAPVLRRIISFEHAIDPDAEGRYAYLTVDAGLIRSGMTHRNEGCHVDGFQGSRITQKNPVNRSYVVSDVLPTVFYHQAFDVRNLDEAKHDFFLEFDRQAKREAEWRPSPYEIVVMDAYTVHRSARTRRATKRVFLRLSFDARPFDRLGNTRNPMFGYEWKMVPRNAHARLRRYGGGR